MSAEQLAAEKRAKTDKRRYVKIVYDGTPCYCKPVSAAYILDDMPEGTTHEDVWMTEAEYEAMPEFKGW